MQNNVELGRKLYIQKLWIVFVSLCTRLQWLFDHFNRTDMLTDRKLGSDKKKDGECVFKNNVAYLRLLFCVEAGKSSGFVALYLPWKSE